MAAADRPPHWLVTDEGHHLGSGWLSGTIGAVLGLAALGSAICRLLPAHLTTPALRAFYPLPVVHAALGVALVLAFVLGAVSLVLRRKKTLGTIAVGSTMLAAGLLAVVPAGRASGVAAPGLGLDVFVLNLLLYSALFVPLERLWPRRREQPTFRPEWWTDFAWFVSSALLIQLTTFLVLAPATTLSFAAAAYLVFVAAQATFVHANVGWRLGWLEPWLVTPRYHHWHHADAPPDVNFAVHLPVLDRLFGTRHLPRGEWPQRYGLAAGDVGPRGFWRQLVAPFVRTG